MGLIFNSEDVGVIKSDSKVIDSLPNNVIFGSSDYHKEWLRKLHKDSWQRKHLNKRWMDWYYRNHARRKMQMLKKYHLNKALSTQSE